MLTQKIKQLRQAKGISRDDMADHLGVSPGTYGKLERGETKLDFERLKAVADRLEVEVTDLIDEGSIMITYNGFDEAMKEQRGVGVSMNSTHYHNDKIIQAQEHTIRHMEETITAQRGEIKQLLAVIDNLSQRLKDASA